MLWAMERDQQRSTFNLATARLRLWLMKTPFKAQLERVADILVGYGKVEPIRIEMTATPALCIATLGVVRVGDDFQKVFVATDTANILRWPGTGAVDARCGLRFRIVREELFDRDDMLPMIAKIVEVDHGKPRLALEIDQPNLFLVERARAANILHFVEFIGIAVGKAADAELVQMIVPPIERGLNDEMKLGKIPADRNDHAPPDGRIDASDLEFELGGIGFFELHDGNEVRRSVLVNVAGSFNAARAAHPFGAESQRLLSCRPAIELDWQAPVQRLSGDLIG